MRDHEDVKNNDKQKPAENWHKWAKTADLFIEYRDKFIKIFSEFESMWDQLLSQISISKY